MAEMKPCAGVWLEGSHAWVTWCSMCVCLLARMHHCDGKSRHIALNCGALFFFVHPMAKPPVEGANTLLPSGVAFILPKAFSVPNADSDEPFELESLAGAADGAIA